MPDHKKILSLAEQKAELIRSLLDAFDELIKDKSKRLTAAIIKTFLDKLSSDHGVITASEQNMIKTALIDRAWTEYMSTNGAEIVTDFITGMTQINDANLKYYRSLSSANINTTDIKNIINYRLGINNDGSLKKDGYMKGLLDDVSVRNEIKKFTYQKMISGTGFEDLRTGLKDLIEGSDGKMGKFEQFHRNFAYDTYVQVDRFNGQLYAEKLGLKYFIYQGTRRSASRQFCIHRKGKVFSTDEAAEWVKLIGTTTEVNGKNVPAGPIVNDKSSYNPLVDLGGYGCVDTVAYVSDEIAFSMRPDLKK